MGDRYLTDLADVCRRTGYPVIEVDGWQTRARGSGGFASGKPDHILIHHTASGPSSDGWPDVDYCTFRDEDAPLCCLYLSRVPEIFICAAGATNTNGTGTDPCGRIGDDTMNSSAIGIEAGNDGVGEIWNQRQQDAYVALVAELGDHYGIAPDQCHAHFEWTSRKVDCAGPSEWAVTGSWNMSAFRADVAVQSPQPPQPTPTPEDDVSNVLILEDARTTAQYRCGAESKSWIRDGNMAAQINMRLAETAQDGVAVDGFRYIKMTNGNVDFIRSTGPIVGPRPAGVDEYGG